MEFYEKEYIYENNEKYSRISEFFCALEFLYLKIKYKSIYGYVEHFFNNEVEKSKIDAIEVLENEFTYDKLITTKLNLSILKSLYRHYYLISCSESKISNIARKKWIINTLILDINEQNSFFYKRMVVCNFKKNLSKTLKYLYIITHYEDNQEVPDLIEDESKWTKLIRKLKDDKIIDKENHWEGFENGFSKSKTQLAVLACILVNQKILREDSQKQTTIFIKSIFGEYLGQNIYSEVKKGLDIKNKVEKNNPYYKIHKKLKSYL